MVNAIYGLGLGAYFGAALNTSEVSTTDLVPSIFPIAIDGKPYNLDFNNPMGGNLYRRDSVALLRTQADSARTAGESSVSPEIFWRRSFDSWHAGAGQTHADRETSNPYRFRSSKGMDVWTRGELKALNNVENKSSATASGNENIGLVVAGSRLYWFNGVTTRFTTSTGTGTWSWTSVTGTPSNAVQGIASDGKTIWIAHTDAIWKTDTSSSGSHLATTFANPPAGTWTGIWFNKGKLFASTSDGKMHTIAAGGTVTPVIDRSTLGFTWTASTGVGGYHYFAGFNGDKSIIFKVTLTAEGTALGAGVVAGELPDDEKVLHLDSYLGYLIIGTNKGVRFANTDGNGYITIGGLIQTNQPVYCSEGQDRFVWFGWGNYDTISSGLGRMDLAEFTSTLTPAYASDLMAGTPALYTSLSAAPAAVPNRIDAVPVLGEVRSVVTWNKKRVFAVQAIGVFGETNNKVLQSTLDTGLISHGIIDNKYAAFLDARLQPLTANIGRITAASANGTTITYTADNSYIPGQRVTITGVISTGNTSGTSNSGFNLVNATIATATSTQFTVTNSLSDTYTSGGSINGVDNAPINNVLKLFHSSDSDDFVASGSVYELGSTYTGEFFLGDTGRNFEVRINFGDVNSIPLLGTDVTCTGFMLRSYPAPKRVSKFSVPIMLFDSINVADRDWAGNPGADFAFLSNLHKRQLPFSFQEGEVSYTVVMDDYQWLPEKRSNVSGFQGTFVAVLREIL
jgi:hypothetical protein